MAQRAALFEQYWLAAQRENVPAESIGQGYGDMFKTESSSVPEEKSWDLSYKSSSPLHYDPVWVRKKRQFWSCHEKFSVWKTWAFKIWLICAIVTCFSIAKIVYNLHSNQQVMNDAVHETIEIVATNVPLRMSPVIVSEFASNYMGWGNYHDENSISAVNALNYVNADGSPFKFL